MEFSAMYIDRYCWPGNRDLSYEAGEKTAAMIIRLSKILDQLEPQGDDNLHIIWVKAARPTFRQYYDRYYGDERPYDKAGKRILASAEKEYKYDYPEQNAWYQLAVKHFTRRSNEEFYAFFIGNHYLFSINDCNSSLVYEDSDLLTWAVEEAESFVEEVRNGTCEKNVLEQIPFIYRDGKIKRSDLWAVNPNLKKEFFKDYKKSEIKKFYESFNSDNPGNGRLPEMTARKYFEACAIIYRSLGRHRETKNHRFRESDEERAHYDGADQTPKEMYYALADGRDNGLKNVPMDDPAAFEEWDSNKGPYYEFNGSHPWEIIPSFSISFSMHLFPRKAKSGEYYFELSGKPDIRAPETVLAANALYEAGYPIKVDGLGEIIDRLKGNDYIYIVPIGESTFYRDSIHLPEGDAGLAVAEKTIWASSEYRLK